MYDSANVTDVLLEDAVRGRIRNHQRCEMTAMQLRLCSQIIQINVAVGIASYANDRKSCHHRAGRVGAVRRLRNQTDVADVFPTTLVKLADDEQPCVFTLRSGVGL